MGHSYTLKIQKERNVLLGPNPDKPEKKRSHAKPKLQKIYSLWATRKVPSFISETPKLMRSPSLLSANLISYQAFQFWVFVTGSWIQFEAGKIFDLLHKGKNKVIWCPDKGDTFLAYIDISHSNAIGQY